MSMRELYKKLTYSSIVHGIGIPKYFSKSGIADIVDTSTYISSNGAEIISSKHTYNKDMQGLVKLIAKSTYIDGLEIDQDANISLILKYIQSIESLKIYVKYKFILKIRKLGQHNAGGLYYDNENIIAVDIDNLSSFIHEVTHMIDYKDGRNEEDRDELIARFRPKITLSKDQNHYKKYYYKDEEIIARLGQLAFNFELFKSNVAPKLSMLYSDISSWNYGVYFNYLKFNKKEIECLEKYFHKFFRVKKSLKLNRINNISQGYITSNYYDRQMENQSMSSVNKIMYSDFNAQNINEIISFNNKHKIVTAEIFVRELIINFTHISRYGSRLIAKKRARKIVDFRTVLKAIVEYAKINNVGNAILSHLSHICEDSLFIDKKSNSKFWKEVKANIPAEVYSDKLFNGLHNNLRKELKNCKFVTVYDIAA